MKNSWVKKVTALLAGILLTSVLFFVVISVSYKGLYEQSVLSVSNTYSSRWTASIDNRLNTMYEHLYDLLVTLYNKTSIRPGSEPMSYTETTEIQDAINYKVMTSSDITAVFLIDSEGSTYLFSNNASLPQTKSSTLKMFLQQYGLQETTTLNNRIWSIIDVLDTGYYYKSIRLGKYVVGIVSDCSLYGIQQDYNQDISRGTCFIKNSDDLIWCQGDIKLKDLVYQGRKDDYFNRGYAISVTDQRMADASTVYIIQPQPFKMPMNLTLWFLVFDSAICVLLVAILMDDLNRRITAPVNKLIEANQQLADGNLEYRLDPSEAGSSEFEDLYDSFNNMTEKIQNLTIESYDLKLKREENRLKMLRAQMHPHTFLNAISTVNNMTYTSTPEKIREYISAFARFTRYMLNKSNDWTTVAEEIQHIQNYVTMQKIRFPDSIEITFDCSPEVQQVRIPYLILFSLVENSFKHAMTLVNTMYINISGETYEEEGFRGIRLIEEDNGNGFSAEALAKLEDPENNEPFTKEHLGLTNVRYSLSIIYKRDDLLRLSNKPDGGAHIELLIPEEENTDETASM
ncbi:MAG: histidine kinase [Erysipelotrichaceae bacterium]|nr:histidine kinase [Erysipelotrichaceae bacterium]